MKKVKLEILCRFCGSNKIGRNSKEIYCKKCGAVIDEILE